MMEPSVVSSGSHLTQWAEMKTDKNPPESLSLTHGQEHKDIERWRHDETDKDFQIECQGQLDLVHQSSECELHSSRSDKIHKQIKATLISNHWETLQKKDVGLEKDLTQGKLSYSDKHHHQDVRSDIVEMKEMLSCILRKQDAILDDIRTLREDTKRNNIAMTESLESNRRVCKDYTDAQVRTMECRVNGLAAVLDHVQTRCMETEIQLHETANDDDSITSSDSTDEQEDLFAPCQDEEMMRQIIEEERNRKWLRQYHLNLIENVNPKHDLLLDRLSQDNILSVSDEEKILSHTTRKNQARELVIKLRRCSSSKFQTFMKHLKSEHPHLACLPTVDGDTGETNHGQKCIVCDITKLVDVDDVIDYVYQRGFLDGVAYEAVWKTEVTEERWCRLLDKLTTKSDGFQVLVEALSKKYPLMSQRLSTSRQSSFECYCSPDA